MLLPSPPGGRCCMKAARLVDHGIALAAGGAAAWLAARPQQPAPTVIVQPAPQIETTEILVATTDIGVGRAITPQDIQWQIWPTAAASSQFIRRPERPAGFDEIVGAIVR